MTDDGSSRSANKQATRPTNTRKPGAGRKRDPTIDDRLRQAARTLYARDGWVGLHFDGVAKHAGVSKDAVYRRYSSPQQLLIEALSDQTVPALEAGKPIEGALVSFAHDVFRYFSAGDGYANLRVHVDSGRYPEVLQQYRTRVLEPQLRQAVGVLEQARKRGEIHADTSCVAVMEALSGAVMFYALASASWLPEDAQPDEIVSRQLTEFVQQVLHGHVRGSRDGAVTRPT
jgi:AcrR family transcriptional regulator